METDHSPRRGRCLDLVQEEVGEEEVAKVVRPDLHLEPVLSLGGHAHMSSSFSDFYTLPRSYVWNSRNVGFCHQIWCCGNSDSWGTMKCEKYRRIS